MTTAPDVALKEPSRASRARSALLAREAVIMVGLYVVYSLIRNHAPNRVGAAVSHSRDILAIEKYVSLDIEHGINHFAAQHTALITVANYMYATLFLPSAIFVLIYLWRRAPRLYVVHRSTLAVMTLLALASYWWFPAAPPRLLPGATYVDTVRFFETWGKPATESGHGVSNEYAAMPSMHFGWALWCGLAFFQATVVTWKRVLAISFPVVTLFVIIATGNHFLLDAVAGAAAYGIAFAAVRVSRRVSMRDPVEQVPAAA
ncbi:phosphatase PAP2 family protein [Cellulomonas edaphi]|uniref:Phosphatase PAP2 family protein n=1 Tax=Cellulomonas edaphi TaxID=3053468 RepID=A0ABT7S7B1_9CELL|nr:phosphatase PAP2 family protein [Cellulomons edaphi]MDM7831510.1 phosphatase PAP2 family protein [Cellulomons edaphi]